jgi:hypothetical protein
VESVASKIQETGQHVAKKGDALLARTREAGEAFVGEVRDAGRELVGLFRGEAKGWRRFLTQRTTVLESDVRGLFAPSAIERQILAQVDGALKTIGAKVRARMSELDKPRRTVRRTANGVARRTARKSRPAAASKSAPAASTASVRH